MSGATMKDIAIDFEFNEPCEKDMGLISVSMQVRGGPLEEFWLRDPASNARFKSRLQELKGSLFIGYSIQQAEARCFAALGLNPNDYQWRDLMMEWRWLRNCDDTYSYGKVIVGGFPKVTYPPIAKVGKKASKEEELLAMSENDEYLDEIKQETGEENLGLQQAGWSMLDCSYFFECLGFREYSAALAEKKEVRDQIIIGGAPELIEANKERIMAYNAADISDLFELADALTEAMTTVMNENDHVLFDKGDHELIEPEDFPVATIQTNLGNWAARLAKYGHRGIPLHTGRLDTLLDLVPVLQEQAILDWNKEHPDTPLYRLGLSEKILSARKSPMKESPFKKGKWTKDQDMLEKIIETFCESTGMEDFPRTKTGKYDTSKKVIDRYAAGENLLKQYQRHQGHLSTLKTFSENKTTGKVEALDYIGTDGFQRPDFGPYGTQTARNAAKAKSFCFLGPHWLRILVDPEPGMAVVSCDFGSQEVFIAGVMGQDNNLINAYKSQDVYLYYAQLTGMYPKDLPIPSEEERSEEWFAPYKKVRSIAKTLNLSLQFGAGYKAVAAAVRDATRDDSITDEDGARWVSEYKEAYADYAHMQEVLKLHYKAGRSLILPSGWRLGPSNPSPLSAGNFPIQGTGSEILRRTCEKADDAGLYVIATLHDEVTCYCKEEDAELVGQRLTQIMKDAAREILGVDGMKVGAPEIVTHGHLWLHSERAKANWAQLGKYFA